MHVFERDDCRQPVACNGHGCTHVDALLQWREQQAARSRRDQQVTSSLQHAIKWSTHQAAANEKRRRVTATAAVAFAIVSWKGPVSLSFVAAYPSAIITSRVYCKTVGANKRGKTKVQRVLMNNACKRIQSVHSGGRLPTPNARSRLNNKTRLQGQRGETWRSEGEGRVNSADCSLVSVAHAD